MHRRAFLAAATTLIAAPAIAANGQRYRFRLVKKELAEGKTVFIDFYTDWCTTCRSQGRTIANLLAENPAYEQNITFIKVDWDEHAQSQLAVRLNIPRRATLVALKGDQEIGRIVASTRKAEIKALLDAALAAAVA